MSELELDPLPPELEALLRSERAAPAPSPNASGRVFSRLAASIAALPPMGVGFDPNGQSANDPTGLDGHGGGHGASGLEGHGGVEGAGGLGDGAGFGGETLGAGGGAAATGAAVGAAKVAGVGASAGGVTLATGGAAKTVGVLLASKLALGTATFIAGGVVGAGVHAVAVRPPAEQKLAKAPTPPPAPPLPLEAVEPEPPPPPPEPVQEVVPPPKATVREAPRDRDATLAAERAVLEIARTALSRQKPEDALEALERHARKFPTGQMREERDALQVQALVGAGRYNEAREAAVRFRRRFPTSLLIPAVDAAEREIP